MGIGPTGSCALVAHESDILYEVALEACMKWMTLLLMSFSLTACVEPSGSTLAIHLAHALEPNADCEFELGNEPWATGWYDPTAASAMEVHLAVEASGFGAADRVDFSELRICYTDESRLGTVGGDHTACDILFRDNTVVSGVFGESADVQGSIVGCADEGCKSQARLDVHLLSQSVLQKIYGEEFRPSEISVWFSDAPMGESGCCRYFYTDLFLLHEEDRLCCAESKWEMRVATGPESGPPWGGFQPRPVTELIVEFQLVGQTQGGETLTSAWMKLPTTLCPGCVRAHSETTGCETMVGSFCDYGVCEVDEEVLNCTQDGCPDVEVPCTSFRFELAGERPNVQGCLPAQMQGIGSLCETVAACE